MYRMTTLALVAAALPGCMVYSGSPGSGTYYTTTTTVPGTVVTNISPYVDDASAYVYFDPQADDDVWAFDAFVSDGNGIADVTQVWADVYDDFRGGGEPVESFELFQTSDPHEWYSDWLGSTTRLDPFYDGYSVDFVVYDAFEDFGYLTVPAQTY